MKIQKFEDTFVKYHFDLVDALLERAEKLQLTDKEGAFRIFLEGYVTSIFYRLRGVSALAKEITGEDIVIPEKYSKWLKLSADFFILKNGELVTVKGDKIDDIITKIKPDVKQ